MKNIYIILSQSGTEISKILKFVTKDKYNHASLCINENFNEFYSFGRKNADFPIPGGFIQENAFKHVFAKYKNIPCLILKKEITDEQYEKLRDIIRDFIINKEKYSYAIISLFLADTHFSITNSKKFFCSQFVAKVLNDISISTPKVPEHMHPIDFLKIEGIEKIYEGELKSFCNEISHSHLQISST